MKIKYQESMESTLLLHIIDFLGSIKLSGQKVKIKFDKESAAVEQNNYPPKIVNVVNCK